MRSPPRDTVALLLDACRAHPGEDTPRLALADALDERGGRENSLWAELIRLQVWDLDPVRQSELVPEVDWGVRVPRGDCQFRPGWGLLRKGLLEKVFIGGFNWPFMAHRLIARGAREVRLITPPEFDPPDWRSRDGSRIPYHLVEPHTGRSVLVRDWDPELYAEELLREAWPQIAVWRIGP